MRKSDKRDYTIIVVFTILTVVFSIGSAFAAPADYHTGDHTIEVNSHGLETKFDKHGNAVHKFKSHKAEIKIKDGGVNTVGELATVWGPKIHPVTGTRRPLCASTDFYTVESGALTCEAIVNWAING